MVFVDLKCILTEFLRENFNIVSNLSERPIKSVHKSEQPSAGESDFTTLLFKNDPSKDQRSVTNLINNNVTTITNVNQNKPLKDINPAVT